MATEWDDGFKIFLDENAQALAEWIFKVFGRHVRVQVREKLLTEFKKREIRADSLLELDVELIVEGTAPESYVRRIILHVEFQSTHDPQIGERLLNYQLEARRMHELPVLSVVIYLRNVGNVPQSPFEWEALFPGQASMMTFHYLSIELEKIPTEEFRQVVREWPSLLPVLPFSREGKDLKVVEEVIQGLVESGQQESLPVAAMLAALIFTHPQEQASIKRSFQRMGVKLRETWFYQDILKEGEEKGLEKGLEKGREEGREEIRRQQVQALRSKVEDVVRARFPKLRRLARKQLAVVEDTTLLLDVLIQISAAQSAEQIKEHLLALDEEDEEE